MTAETDDERYQRWQADFKIISDEIMTLSVRKTIFDGLDGEICRVNGSVATMALDQFLRPMYAEAQAALVRRLAEKDRYKRSVSLHRLITDMIDHPEVLSRERHVHELRQLWDRSGHHGTDADAGQLFDEIAGTGEPFVPMSRLEPLGKQILDDAAAIAKHVNKYVAHRDRQRPSPVTWGDLNVALTTAAEHYTEVGRLRSHGER